MKHQIQLTSFVYLAVLYGSVTATPIPAEATGDAVPSISDAILGTGGSLLSTAFQALAPSAAFNGAVSSANACIVNSDGRLFCPRAEESEDAVPSISDAVLNTGGNLLSTAFQALAPSAAFNGAVSSANACIVNSDGRLFCPRGEESEDAVPSISDAFLNTGGNLLSTAFQALAPSAAFNGAVSSANACIVNSDGRLFCPRGEESEDAVPSISDAFLNTGGSLLSTAFQALAPSAAFNGAVSSANACIVNSDGRLFCPRAEESEDAVPSISDAFLNTGGSLLSTAFQALAPSAAFNGAVSSANACIVNSDGRLFCPRDEESQDAVPSISDAFLNTGGNLLSTAFQALAPSAAFNGAVSSANACIVNSDGRLFCPRGEESEDAVPSISDAFLNTGGNLLSTAFQALAPSAAFNGAVSSANACIVNSDGRLFCPRAEESEDAVPSISDAFLNTGGNLLSTAFQALAPSAAFNGAVSAANACIVSNGKLYCPSS